MKGCAVKEMIANENSIHQKRRNTKLVHQTKENTIIYLTKKSYLQQHAYNPVDWYPWGVEAFQKALKENKPIFFQSVTRLAIGATLWNMNPLRMKK